MKQTLIQEAQHIRSQNAEGLLQAHEVVEFAEDPSTALHAQFEWDDVKAGHEYRLEQARRFIRAVVTFEPNLQRNMRGFVSLKSDRAQPGGGYRTRDAVMSAAEMREELLQEALEELNRLKDKYQMLSALKGVFDAIDAANAKTKTAKKRKTTKKKTASKKKASSSHTTP